MGRATVLFMDLDNALEELKKRLLEGWILVGGYGECISRIVSYTDELELVIVPDGGRLYPFFLIRKSSGLRGLLRELDSDFDRLIVLDLVRPVGNGCQLNATIARRLEEGEVEGIVNAIRGIVMAMNWYVGA